MKEQRTDVRQEDSKDGNEGRREGCVGRNKDTMEGRKEGRNYLFVFCKAGSFFRRHERLVFAVRHECAACVELTVIVVENSR